MREVFYHWVIAPNFMTSFTNRFSDLTEGVGSFPFPVIVISCHAGVICIPRFGTWQTDDIFRVHADLFNQRKSHSIIRVCDWYPHLADYLFNLLAVFFYCRANHFDLKTYQYTPGSQSSLFNRYIIKCLPYAEPTQKNLNALRAVVHFYGRLTSSWYPPNGFCGLIRQFLEVS